MILALDTASTTGWALGSLDCEPESGHVRLPKTDADIGKFINAYRDWLREMCRRYEPSEIVFEAALLSPGKFTNARTIRKLNGLAAMTESVASELGLRCSEGNLSTIRKHFVGQGRAPKEAPDGRKWFKAQVMKRCEAKGWTPDNDDEGDALALLDYALWCRDPSHPGHQPAEKSAPLFEGTAS